MVLAAIFDLMKCWNNFATKILKVEFKTLIGPELDLTNSELFFQNPCSKIVYSTPAEPIWWPNPNDFNFFIVYILYLPSETDWDRYGLKYKVLNSTYMSCNLVLAAIFILLKCLINFATKDFESREQHLSIDFCRQCRSFVQKELLIYRV